MSKRRFPCAPITHPWTAAKHGRVADALGKFADLWATTQQAQLFIPAKPLKLAFDLVAAYRRAEESGLATNSILLREALFESGRPGIDGPVHSLTAGIYRAILQHPSSKNLGALIEYVDASVQKPGHALTAVYFEYRAKRGLVANHVALDTLSASSASTATL